MYAALEIRCNLRYTGTIFAVGAHCADSGMRRQEERQLKACRERFHIARPLDLTRHVVGQKGLEYQRCSWGCTSSSLELA